MAWTLTDDIASYRAAAGGLLSADPVRNTVLLSVLASLVEFGLAAFGPEPPLFGWWSEHDQGTSAAALTRVAAAILRTPPHELLFTTLPGPSAAQLAGALADRGAALPGINGGEQDATALAVAWHERTGRRGQVSQRQRLYRLGDLVRTDRVPDGAARVATEADAAIVRALYSAFAAEVGHEDAPEQLIADRLMAGQLMLWETDGEPVSFAGSTGVLEGVARIGPVYTPPRWRGRGYGGAVTTAIGELARERGAASVVLFTDLANPASNSLYVRLGYRPVEDRVVLRFCD
ncbi:MAG TPA: GNAT family N-acetyltransferase [Streptosporangiaceae bacterium]|nr:GNAT family N-acetyltransferase [Streptosporangiaceae bacterium]